MKTPDCWRVSLPQTMIVIMPKYGNSAVTAMKIWVFSFFLILLLCANIQNDDTDCTIEQLTEGATYQTVQIDNHRIIWSGYERTEAQGIVTPILLYAPDISDTPIRITEALVPDYPPQIDGNNIIWLSGFNLPPDIFLYQMDTVQTLQITDDQLYKSLPHLHNGQVVWARVTLPQNALSDDGEIYLYDIETGITTQITQDDMGDYAPRVYKGQIVWLHVERGETQLWFRDTTGAIMLISENVDPNSHPQINDQWIVWTSDNDNNQRDIWLYDLRTATQQRLSAQGVVNSPPMMSDSGSVWQAYDGDDTDIFYYDGERIQQITTNDERDYSPYLDDDAIVWVGERDGQRNIFHYDIASDTTTQITFNDYNVSPRVDNGWIVWLGNSDADGADVFLRRCE